MANGLKRQKTFIRRSRCKSVKSAKRAAADFTGNLFDSAIRNSDIFAVTFGKSLFGCVIYSIFIASQGFGQSEFPADHFDVSAVIDGNDVLRLSKSGATWVHKTWSWPTDIRINGSPWDPQRVSAFPPGPSGRLLRDGLDFSWAVIHVLRGRGSVRCGLEGDDLVITFDDPAPGADLYEVLIEFAPVLVRKQDASATPADLQLHIAARIDGMDECWLSESGLSWTHTGWQMPQNVTVNGKSWDVSKPGKLSLGLAVLPEIFDLQKATMRKYRGRDTMNLDYRPERSVMEFEYYDPSVGDAFATPSEQLCLDFEDPENGADDYEATVTVPTFRQRFLVRLEARGVTGILGTPVRIFRAPASTEAQAVLAGQRFFGANGDCLVALEAGRFQFEALQQDTSGHLIALRSDWVQITGPTNINLDPISEKPSVILPSEAAGSAVEIENLSIRSVRPGGAIQWSRGGETGSEPYFTLSRGQTYRVHAFGHAGTNYFAVWTAFKANDNVALKAGGWLDRSFKWGDGTPETINRGVLLNFPDGNLEIPGADRCRLFTNRRFFTIGYRLDFLGGRRAIFEPRAVLDSATHGEVLLGGALRPVASAAILEDENLGNPSALNLWHETTVVDQQGYILDTAASSIGWSENIRWKDGGALPRPPLPADVASRIRNNPGQLVERASCLLDKPVEWTISPSGMSPTQLNWYSTMAPAYRSWNTVSYLSKANREYSILNQLGGIKDDAKKHINIKWWFNNGAVGGGDSVTMPIRGYLECTNWFSHTWAIAHETLHNFGFGHTHEMNRLDDAVQEQMDFFRWSVADNPDYRPAELDGW